MAGSIWHKLSRAAKDRHNEYRRERSASDPEYHARRLESQRRSRKKNGAKWNAAKKTPEKRKQYNANRKPPTKRYARHYQLLANYGITLDEFEAMASEQDGRCAICQEATTLCVDHCHKTGRIRALLCRRCNVGIGSLRDDPDLLKKAEAYLRGSLDV